MLHQGDKIGPYTLVQRLGQGAFGVVWLAEKRSAFMTIPVALKIPVDDEPDLEVIRHEAQIWLKASGHPNVLPVLDADVYDGQVVIVSEYAPDGTLLDWLKKHGGEAPSTEAAVQMIAGILSGLQHLHGLKMIHRDLKPGNVLLKGDTPCLTDFGLARVLKTTAKTTQVSGTPAYMAPEMFGGRYSVQSDLWAVGVMLYRMLSGHLPFEANSLWEWAEIIKTKIPRPLPDSVPAAMRRVVGRALQKSPAARYASAQEMLDALLAAAGQLQPAISAAPQTAEAPEEATVSPSQTVVPRTAASVAPAPTSPVRRLNRGVLIGIACACGLVFMGSTYYYATSDDSARSVTCLSNLKKCVMALNMYSQDYDEVLPPAAAWMDVLIPYHRSEEIYKCPGSTFNRLPPGAYGYAYNVNLSNLLEYRVDLPASTPAIYDSLFLQRNASDDFTSPPDPFRHNQNQRNNIGYLDGHAKSADESGQERARMVRKQISDWTPRR